MKKDGKTKKLWLHELFIYNVLIQWIFHEIKRNIQRTLS